VSFETLAIGALVAGAGLSAFGSIQQGYAAQEQAEYNAAVAENNAAAARSAAALDEENVRKRNARILGTIRARGAMGSGELGGSALDVLGDSVSEAELEALVARYTGEVQARRFESEAAFTRKRGKDDIFAGYTGAAAALLQAGTSAYKLFSPAKESGGGIPALSTTVPYLGSSGRKVGSV